MLGLKGGNANHACPWCTANLKKPLNVNETFSLRSYEEAIKTVNLSKKENDFGYLNIPIIDFIQYDDVLIDILHLLIRISEKMFDSLIEKINQFERKQYGELDSRPVLNHFFEILSNTCSIRKPFNRKALDDDKIEITIRSLNGNEILQIFENLDADGAELSNFFSKKKKTF